MKKTTLLLSLLFLIASWEGFTQVFPESFETSVPPSGWASFRGLDDAGPDNDWTQSGTANTGDFSAFVRYSNFVDAEDWLVTPQFTPDASANVLEFFQLQAFGPDYGTTYDVLVSTTSQTDISSFTVVDAQTEADVPLAGFAPRYVDLSPYNDTAIYVAFRMSNNFGDNWYIDDVNLIASSSPPNCAVNPSPADMAMDVAITPSGDLTLSWTPSADGDPASSFEFSFGTASGVYDLITTVSDPEIDLTNLTNSTTYYWMVVPSNSGGSAAGCAEWSFTTEDPPAAPDNDLCSGATSVPVGDGACGDEVTGTNQSATDSGVPQASCAAADYSGGDIWYSFTVPDGETSVNYVVSDSDFSTTQAELYSGSCGALTEVDCTTTTSYTFTGLSSGETYYLRLYDWGNNDVGSVTFCLGTPPPPPANDDPSNAIGLIIGADFAANQTSVSNVSATASEDNDPSIPDPSCSNYGGGDVWYSLMVPADGIVSIETNNDPNSTPVISDTGMSVYTGSIGSLVEYECDDDDSDDGFHSLIDIDDQALANQMIYVRVFEFGNNSFGNWFISAFSTTLSNSEFESNQLSYYPNPTEGKVRFEAASNIDRILGINMLGQTVFDLDIDDLTPEVDLSALQTGTYFLRVFIGESIETIRIIKK